ncbi:MAG TPA: hypothetical protein VHE81_20195 [Lacipirellulaceae bacterium]|nr:hypothetical protein [Lacipirellulaceae bacterium]
MSNYVRLVMVGSWLTSSDKAPKRGSANLRLAQDRVIVSDAAGRMEVGLGVQVSIHDVRFCGALPLHLSVAQIPKSPNQRRQGLPPLEELGSPSQVAAVPDLGGYLSHVDPILQRVEDFHH